MIYEVYVDGELLYYPDDKIYAVFNSEMETALNDSGTFSCDIPLTNPAYGSIKNRISMVQVLRDGREIFYGEVREIEENLDRSKHIYAVGELSFLYDSIQPQSRYQNRTPQQFFTELINIHNSQVEEKKQFQVGIVTVVDPNDSIYRYTNYEDTLTAMRDKLCDRLGGYLRVRKVNGERYLDLVPLNGYGKRCNQPIEFGYNLLEYSKTGYGSSIATAVIPLGSRLEESEIDGLEAYTTINDVNGGKDYVYIPEAVEHFGWIKVVKRWDDVTEPANLKRKAEEWLRANQYESLVFELNAVDLSAMDLSIDSYEVGDYANVLAVPYGMNTWFPVQKKKTYLQDLSKNYISLGTTQIKKYTDAVKAGSKETGNKIDGVNQTISQEIQARKQQFEEEIRNGSGLFHTNVPQPNGSEIIYYHDKRDMKDSQILMTFNTAGFAVSPDGGANWYGLEVNGDFIANILSATGINADWIRTGALVANLIQGGILTDKTGRSFWDLDNGTMNVTGTYTHTGVDGKTCITIAGRRINFFDWETESGIVGGISSVKSSEDGGATGVSIFCKPDMAVKIGISGVEDTRVFNFLTVGKEADINDAGIRVAIKSGLNMTGAKIVNCSDIELSSGRMIKSATSDPVSFPQITNMYKSGNNVIVTATDGTTGYITLTNV